ncbi:MAG: hypothetical protein ABT10_08265 [Novosphingobium sp. SCN 63-17]|nr:MAG: hypothetical protein ABT10_08265 [Novosphingobium sp. SCN 63-17]OJX88090.1 MAG: hypothetical protein BGP00_01875 [Novosphingobium sp. 63-713]
MPRLLPATIPGWAWNNAQPALMAGALRQIRCFTLQFGVMIASKMADMRDDGQAMPIQHELNQEWIWTHRAFWS